MSGKGEKNPINKLLAVVSLQIRLLGGSIPGDAKRSQRQTDPKTVQTDYPQPGNRIRMAQTDLQAQGELDCTSAVTRRP